MDFLALSLIMATHSVSVVRRGYSASLHSPGKEEINRYSVTYRVQYLQKTNETEKAAAKTFFRS